jgi:tetratricopeptide (TPR) repeat protein
MGAEEEMEAGERALARLDYDGAFAHFAKAAKLDPKNPWARFGMAEASLGVSKVEPETRLAFYAEAVKLAPDVPPFLDAYANACMDLGRFADAEKAYGNAAEADPENAPFYFSEFAVRFWREAPGRMAEMTGQEPDEETLDVIARKALDYMLRALDMDRTRAKRLL